MHAPMLKHRSCAIAACVAEYNLILLDIPGELHSTVKRPSTDGNSRSSFKKAINYSTLFII